MKRIVTRDLEDRERLLANRRWGGGRPETCSWENAAAFAYDVYGGFQNKEQILAMATDHEDAYNTVQFRLPIHMLVQYGVSLTTAR